jgi:hypothetical protein
LKELYEPGLLRRQLLWALFGGLCGMILVPLFVIWLNSLSVMPWHNTVLIVRQAVLEATGWTWQALLTLEVVLAFAFGAMVGVAVPPMEGSGRAVAVRTAAHLLGSSLLFAGLCAVCGLMPAPWQGWLVLLGLYWFAYAVVWLLRYLVWRAELEQIREGLGLTPTKKRGGVFQLRPIRTYLLLAAAVELGLPPLLRLLEGQSDFPILTGIVYPYLLLPFFCVCTGWSAGRRFGIALLYPAACGLLAVPHVFLLYNSSALFHAGVAVLFVLLGNLPGAAVRWGKERAHETGDSSL